MSSCSLGTLDLQGNLRIIGTNTFTLTNGTTTAPAVVTGNGDLYINTAGAGGITIASSSNSYSGHVVIDQSDFGAGAAAIAGNLILTSTAPGGATPPSGSLTGAQSIDVRAGGSLIVRNNASNSLQNGNRIGDNTPVRLRDGTFELDGPAIAGTNSYTPHDLNEQIGALSGAGNNTVYVLPTAASGVVTTLEVASLGRGAGADRGTFNFRSTAGMGDGLTATRAKFIVDAGIAGTDLVGGNGSHRNAEHQHHPLRRGGRDRQRQRQHLRHLRRRRHPSAGLQRHTQRRICSQQPGAGGPDLQRRSELLAGGPGHRQHQHDERAPDADVELDD